MYLIPIVLIILLLSKCFGLFSHERWQALVWCLSISDTAKLIQSLITFWLDYRNAVLRGSPGCFLWQGMPPLWEHRTREEIQSFYSDHIMPFAGYKQEGLTKNGTICSWVLGQLGNGVTARAGASPMWWAIAVQKQHGKGMRVRLKPTIHTWSFLDKRVRAAWVPVCASFAGCLRELKGSI